MGVGKEYIGEIKERQLRSDKEFILDSLTGAIDRLQKAFPRYGSFLMEFVQNADDAKSKFIRIEFLDKSIRISNDGLPFAEKDVKSICKVGRSSKTPKDYIGYLGVGFKAVFLISESPEIYSGDYTFKFDKSSWDEPEHTPWQVIPLWLDKPTIELKDRGTIFNLPLKASELVTKLKEETTPEHLNNRILLFLRHVEAMTIIDSNNNFSRIILKEKVSETPEYEIIQIIEMENKELKSSDLWAVFKSTCEVPPDVRNDFITKEWERENVEKREILVAFKLDGENRLIKEEKGTAHIGVFSFLPLKEVPSGLNFLIQADFLTTPGRGELARECLWNDWLAKEIYKLIIEKSIPTFLKDEKWQMNFTEILYSSQGGHELFEAEIKKPLNDFLEKTALLIAEDGTPAKAEDLVKIGDEVRALITEEDLKIIYPGKKVIHKGCKTHYSLQVETAPSEIDSFLSSPKSDELLQQKAKAKDIDWFKKVYTMLVDKYGLDYFRDRHFQYNVEHDRFWSRMRDFSKPIILTEDYSLAKINESYTNPKKLKIPEQIKGRLKIVHPYLAQDEKFKQLQKRLNEQRYYTSVPSTKVLGELTEADLQNILSKQEALELDEKAWAGLSESEKFERVKHIKDAWGTKYFPLEKKYDFLTLKSKTGEWVKPEELIFPKEYKPEHNIEIIKENRLLDLPLKFLSEEFIQGENETKIKEWGRFFKELGVDESIADRTHSNNLIQRIGILVALKYEIHKGRKARELSRSEEIGGYDITQVTEEGEEEASGIIQSEERYIEVKGRKQPSPDIFLTTKQLNTLKDKQEKYFVYVVKDALRYPTLCVTRGDKLLEITDIKIIIPFNKWSNQAQDEEYMPFVSP